MKQVYMIELKRADHWLDLRWVFDALSKDDTRMIMQYVEIADATDADRGINDEVVRRITAVDGRRCHSLGLFKDLSDQFPQNGLYRVITISRWHVVMAPIGDELTNKVFPDWRGLLGEDYFRGDVVGLRDFDIERERNFAVIIRETGNLFNYKFLRTLHGSGWCLRKTKPDMAVMLQRGVDWALIMPLRG